MLQASHNLICRLALLVVFAICVPLPVAEAEVECAPGSMEELIASDVLLTSNNNTVSQSRDQRIIRAARDVRASRRFCPKYRSEHGSRNGLGTALRL